MNLYIRIYKYIYIYIYLSFETLKLICVGEKPSFHTVFESSGVLNKMKYLFAW